MHKLTSLFGLYERLFNTIDENGDGYLSASELRALIIGIEFQGINLDEHDAVDKVMKEFDTSGDFRVDLVEFTEGIRKWLTEAKKCSKYQHREKKELQLISDFHTVCYPLYIFIFTAARPVDGVVQFRT